VSLGDDLVQFAVVDLHGEMVIKQPLWSNGSPGIPLME
jgi:hypothetical protein